MTSQNKIKASIFLFLFLLTTHQQLHIAKQKIKEIGNWLDDDKYCFYKKNRDYSYLLALKRHRRIHTQNEK